MVYSSSIDTLKAQTVIRSFVFRPSSETNAAIEELEEQRQRQEEEGVYREVLATTTVYSIISPSSSATTASASMSGLCFIKDK